MKLNQRQMRCLQALKSGCDQIAQANATSAAWHARTKTNDWVRLSLTGGDVWKMTKLGLIERVPDERKFTLPERAIHLVDSEKKPMVIKRVRIAA
jgi:hypothetical protein